jgi:hypothetical protein
VRDQDALEARAAELRVLLYVGDRPDVSRG